MKRSVLSAALAVCLSSLVGTSFSATIVSDSFNVPGGNLANLVGRVPDADAAGSTWTTAGQGGGASISNNEVSIGPDIAGVISIASAGSYVEPQVVHISASLNNNGDPNDDGFVTRGLTLGFYSNNDVAANAGNRLATGITYSPSGALRLVENGSVLQSITGFSNSGPHTLSYTMNLVTGSVSNVVFDSTSVTFTSSLTITDPLTYAGFTSNSFGSPTHFVDNFNLQSVPEPAAISLFVLGTAGLMLVARKRRSLLKAATSRTAARVSSVLLIGLVAVGFSAPALADTVIFKDSFTGSGTIVSHDPNAPGDVNLPGNPTPYINGNSPNNIGSITANTATVGNDGAWAISLASTGGYTKPNDFTISADLNLNGMTPAAGGGDINTVGQTGFIGGIALGFFPNPVTTLSDERRSPLGVVYSDLGNLLLVRPDVSTLNTVLGVVSTYDGGIPIPTTGTHNLSYQVDTQSGNVFNVTFDGFAINFGVSTNLFTDANTFLAGNYSRSGDGNTWGTLDNFTITAVPEPATLVLSALSAVALVAVARNRRRAA